MTTARSLDHLIHLVENLDAAAAAYEALGFRVGAENRHPFGTKNRLIQFPGVFLELLAIDDPRRIPEHDKRHFSFAAFHRDRLARGGEGGSGVVLSSRDVRADAAGFAKAGVADFDPFFFERRGRRPDGSETHVAFELAFAADPGSHDACFFACEHKFPQNFWSEAAQAHPNGATGVRSVVLVAENPSDHAVFLSAFTGVRDFRASSLGLVIALDHGAIEVLTPTAWRQRSGESVEVGDGLSLAGVAVTASDLSAFAGHSEARGGAVVVPATRLFGMTLVVEAA